MLAGLAAGAVVIPQAMAYATVADMPAQFGLYTCMVPLVVYAFIGGSRTASVSTTSTIATLTASTMVGAGITAGSTHAGAELVTLTLMVGSILLVARVLRLGSIVENINQATLVGIKAGVGLTVAVTQLPKLLGLPAPDAEGFLRTLAAVTANLGQTHAATALLAAVSAAILLSVGRFLPAVPGPLVVVVLGIGLTAFAGLGEQGVALIPPVPQGIPLPSLPSLDHVGQLVPGALAISLLAFMETVSVARAVRRPDEPQIDADRELGATGLAAVIGSFFHALPPAGGFSQTSVNVKSGARTQVAGLVTATLAVFVALFLAPVLSDLPQASLGAMVLVATIGLVDVGALRALYRFDRVEFALAMVVALFALTAGLLPAVAVGVALTLYQVLREVNGAHVVQVVRRAGQGWHELEVGAAAPADPLVLRFQQGLYAANLRANTTAVRERVDSDAQRPRAVVLDLRRLPKVTSSVLDGLRDFEAELAGVGVRIVYAGLAPGVRDVAQRWPWWERVESEGRYYADVDAAVGAVGD